MASPDLSIVLAALPLVAPTARTACAEWTAHELRAHLAAGAQQRAELVEDVQLGPAGHLHSSLADREAPFLALPDSELRTAMLRESRRFADAALALTARDSTATVLCGDTRFTPAQLLTHQHCEAAIHCWDLLGDDGVNDEQLARPALTRHSVLVLNELELAEAPLARAARAGIPGIRVALRSPGRPHVIFDARGGRVDLVDDPPAEVDAVVSADPGTRLLVLWGRRPPNRDFEVEVKTVEGLVVEELLWPDAVGGYARRGS